MTWFKVDDGLHASTKARRAGEAMALWVMAGSWCADQLTDGWLPEDMAEVLAPKQWRRWSAKLVQVGLWVVEAHGAEAGWRFHDWDGYQPSREQVLADRKAAADRQQRARDRARESRRDGRSSSRVNHAVTDPVTTPVSHGPPDPTRPDLSTTQRPYGPPGRVVRAPVEAPPTSAEPSRVELLITQYRELSPRGLSSRQAERLSEEIYVLIHDGFTEPEILQGLMQLRPRKLGPAMLAALVEELANTAHETPGNVVALRPRQSTTDLRVADAVERGRRLQALHDQQEIGS